MRLEEDKTSTTRIFWEVIVGGNSMRTFKSRSVVGDKQANTIDITYTTVRTTSPQKFSGQEVGYLQSLNYNDVCIRYNHFVEMFLEQCPKRVPCCIRKGARVRYSNALSVCNHSY